MKPPGEGMDWKSKERFGVETDDMMSWSESWALFEVELWWSYVADLNVFVCRWDARSKELFWQCYG
jgi:hypothetical protein